MATQHPNIVWIFLDQCRADVLGAYGHPFVQTPNLDRLAHSGVLFEHAYCQNPICVPSRVSILSGLYSHQNGVFNNADKMNPDDSLLLHAFQAGGYATASVGKVHLGIAPRAAGFDEHHTIEHQGIPHMSFPPDYPADRPHKRFEVDGFPQPVIYGTDLCPREETYCAVGVDQALDIFARHNHTDGPLLLRLSLDRPHTPVTSPKPYDQMYASNTQPPVIREGELAEQPVPVRNRRKERHWDAFTAEEIHHIRTFYYGLVTHVDAELGRLLDQVAASPQADNTLVALTVDHGCMLGEHGLYVKGRHIYAETHRVPLLLSWPGRMPAGKRVTDLVEMVDFLPTLCELADLPVPERAQGRSLLPLIAGKGAGRDAVFAEQKVQDTHLEAVRTKRYAYTRYRNSGDRVLFDLESDPHEQTNLMQRDPPAEVVRDLEKRLDTWLET